MMAVSIGVDSAYCHSTDYSGLSTRWEFYQDHLVACVHSWNDAKAHCSMGTCLVAVAWQDRYQYGEGDKKG
jgi:hypothetical protein